MLLKTAQVENYKCIEDSTQFTFESVTCLVGKNEAGKSALLQALYKLKPDIPSESVFEPLLEYPRRGWSEYKDVHEDSPDNVLTTIWELEDADLIRLKEIIGPDSVQSNKVIISKGYNNMRYYKFEIDASSVVPFYLEKANLIQSEKSRFENEESVDSLIDRLEALTSPTERLSNLLRMLNEQFPEKNLMRTAINIIDDCLPTFLYFPQYYYLPGQVSINDLSQKIDENRLNPGHRVFLALMGLVGTSPEELHNIGKFEGLIAELEAVSNRLTDEIFEYWSQNKHLEVSFHFDNARPEDPAPFNSGYIFRTRIKNRRHGVTVSFDERSAGFVWFFSFLIWFSQVKRNYGENLIILLDDPGLNLHAKAQADLLRYINEKLAPNYQVVYTTHSPFMIDPAHILRARTVEDVFEEGIVLGTKVGDNVLSTDADTILPLQAALGYDITQTLFVGKHTLLVEGPSDLLYLKWFSQELRSQDREGLDRRWVLSPAGGIDKVASFITLFSGTELHVAVLADYKKGMKQSVERLRELELIKKGHVFTADMYVDQDEADIEDLIGRSLYIRLVNGCYELDDPNKIPSSKPSGVPDLVLQEVEDHFRTLPPEIPEFDHYTPASHLVEHPDILRHNKSLLETALKRFEKFFMELNKLLTEG